MATTGQTINDRLNAVRYALGGQGLARTVCKATTEEILGPKKKHIDYLIACTNEPNVSIPQMANLLIERTQHTSWAVVFKSLATIHHLMSHGNERFTQYLATSNHSFNLPDFMDRTTPQGYNMSTFVRRYAKYIDNKAISYRTLAIDLCKIRSGNDNALRTMNMDNLSKTLPILQGQFDSLLDFDAGSKDLNNGIIMSAFRLLYKDLVRLYVAYQEAIINLLERYTKLSRKKTREALEMYKRYLERMNKVANFFRIVDAVGLDKSEMPDLTDSPASILEALENHLAQLEAKKRGQTTPVSSETNQGENEANKENEPKSKGETIKVAEKREQKVLLAEDEEQQPSSSNERPKQPPPQKPARPSPKASPKKSPSSTKPEVPKAVSHAPERKAPPTRPAKPPSRPPPPSGGSQVTTIGSPTSLPRASGPESTTKKSESPVAATQSPPHPPPPVHSSHSSQHPASSKAEAPKPELASTASSTQPEAPTSETSNNDIGNNNLEADDQSNNESVPSPSPSPQYPPPPACSTVNSETVDENSSNSREVNHNNHESLDGNAEHEANHVNVVNQELVDGDEMPAPPPPIDDEEPAVSEEVAHQEPILNGQNSSDGAE